MFTCTIAGDGIIQWDGTAFDCTNFNNEILLSYNDFPEGNCNDGQITGTSLSVENNCFTSQLSMNTSAAFNNKTIRCVHNNQNLIVGTTVLIVISGEE